jgi:cytochrome b
MTDISSQPPQTKVWDPFVRVSHWVVALGYFIAYIVEDDWLTLHVWAGYVVGGLVVLRIAWGFVGPRHARFTDFVYAPRRVVRYTLDLVLFRAERHIGHSPAGGAMVIALLAVLLATAVTGVLLYGAEERAGPAAGLYDAGPEQALVAPAPVEAGTRSHNDDDDDDDDEGDEHEGRSHRGHDGGALEEVHEVLANLSLILVIAHICGVVLASLVHRENLPRAMITGRKRP